MLDPEKPVEPDDLFDYFIRPEQQPFAYRHLMKVIFLIAGVLALAAIWRWTPAGEWVDIESARSAGEWIRRQPLTPVLVIVAYILGGIIAFPVTLLVMATVMVFRLLSSSGPGSFRCTGDCCSAGRRGAYGASPGGQTQTCRSVFPEIGFR